MKPLLLLSILALAACNKPKCWTCTEIMYSTREKDRIRTVEFCNKTKTEIESLERGYSNTFFDSSLMDSVTRGTRYTCDIKR